MSTGIGIGGPGGGAGSADNSWNVPGVAFVSDSGDDGTGTVGDGNLPYKTVAAAHAASSKVIILSGTYTEAVALKSATTYFSYPGVLFTGGGLTLGETSTDTKWLGYSSFVGSFQPFAIYGYDFTNLVLEFDKVDGTAVAVRAEPASDSTFTITANSMNFSSPGAAGFSFGGDANGTMTVRDSIKAFYGVLMLEPTYTFDGDVTVNCPRIECLTGGLAADNAAYKQTFLSYGSTATSRFTINGDLYLDSIGSTLASLAAAISVQAATAGTIEFNGKIFAGKQRPIRWTGTGKLISKGRSLTENKTFDITAGEVILDNMRMVQGVANSITGSPTVWIEGSSFHSSAAGNIIDYTTGTAQLIINNTSAEGVAAGEFVNTGGAANAVGMDNVKSNLANDGAMTNHYATAPVGFTQEANVITPDFI